MAALKAVVLAGPDPAVDKIARWRIVDLCRWVERRWGVSYSETGMLRLLWSLDLSHRKTRPRHPQSDEEAQHAEAGTVTAHLLRRSTDRTLEATRPVHGTSRDDALSQPRQRCLLQPPRHLRAVRRQGRDQVDPLVVPLLRCQRRPPPAPRAGL
jgi:hypothetical protein